MDKKIILSTLSGLFAAGVVLVAPIGVQGANNTSNLGQEVKSCNQTYKDGVKAVQADVKANKITKADRTAKLKALNQTKLGCIKDAKAKATDEAKKMAEEQKAKRMEAQKVKQEEAKKKAAERKAKAAEQKAKKTVKSSTKTKY